MPEASAGWNHSDTPISLAVDGTVTVNNVNGETLLEAKAVVDDTATSVTSTPEPDEASTSPRDVSQGSTPSPAATEANAPEILPESLGVVVGGSQQGSVAGTAVDSMGGSIVPTFAPSTRVGDNARGVVGSPSPSLAEHGQAGVTVAPAESLVRLKRRRPPARSNSHR